MRATANFNLRKRKDGRASIVLIIRLASVTIKYTTGLTILPEEWSIKAQRPVKGKRLALSKKLNSSYEKIESLLTNLSSDSFSPTRIKEQIAEIFGHVKPKSNSFFDFAEKYCTGKRSDFMCAVKNLRVSNNGRDLFFNEINSLVLKSFVAHLKKKNLEASTINKYLSQINQVFEEAFEEELHTSRLPLKKYRVSKKGSDQVPITLTASEIIALCNLDLKPNLERARDLFIIGILTGQRCGDYSQITPDMISNGYIYFRQQKTGTSVVIPIDLCDGWGLPIKLSELLIKYDWHSPKVSKQMFRRYLKRIAQMCITSNVEIVSRPGGELETSIEPKKNHISTHTARRSFATIWNKLGMPEEELIVYTGHADVEMLRRYIGITEEERKRKAREAARRVSRPITELEGNVVSINSKSKTA